MRRSRHAKILATLGPASSSEAQIRSLFETGADVFRLNFSHGGHADHAERLRIIRKVEQEVGRPIGVLLDLQGPKLRIGTIAGGKIPLAVGDRWRLDMDPAPGDAKRAPLLHPEIFAAVHAGTDLLVDDGKVRLRIDRSGPDFAETTVVVGGPVSDRKGVNVPGVVLPISPLTAKDRKDLDFGLELGVDWVALSFVQRPQDIEEARALIGDRAWIMAKLEKPSALDHLEAIVQLCDGIMVARGDLGVEMPPEQVPELQRRIVRSCRRQGKPVVVATQMLESMISSPSPTRAEASDVATAVFDGADAVMLSAESAVGKFPIEAIRMMDRIAVEVESDPSYGALVHATRTPPQATAADAIAAAAHTIADTLNLACIICYTATGSTALRVARERPGLSVIGLSPVVATGRKLAMVWGVHCVLTSDPENQAAMVRKACRIAFDEGFAKSGDGVLIVAGVPLGSPGTTNMVRIAHLDEAGNPVAEGV
ncbi:MAG: pyruvate kinase [Luteibacter sp.]